MPAHRSPSQPLFLIEGDALLSGGAEALQGALAGDLARQHADWVAGVAHAPPWRVLSSGLGIDVAPAALPPQLTAHFLAGDALTGAALSLAPDSHSIAGVRSAPILRVLAQVTLDLATELDSRWVVWAPAGIAYPRAFLAEQMEQWQIGGLIPLLAFLRFGEDAGGAQVTRGLAFFGLPELRFIAKPAMAKGDAVRRMVRMAYALLADGQVGQSRAWDGEYDGLAPGERMTVRRRGDMLNLTSTMRD